MYSSRSMFEHGGPHFSSQEGGDAGILVTIVAVG